MGGGSFDNKLYRSSATFRATKGIADFGYDHDTKATKSRSEWAAHEELDPKKIKGGVRESRDSAEHPDSRAIVVLFDVTGSMEDVPKVFQKKLGTLMSMLMMKGGIEHPQILVGGIGDATCDQVPMQLSQFESSNLIDEHLRKMFIEGGGGGQATESYELGLYFAARMTSIDCYEKRKQKGYLFLSGDEKPYGRVKGEELKRVFGLAQAEDVSLLDIIKEAQEKYNVYFIIPTHTSHGAEFKDVWQKLLGQNVLTLEDEGAVSELIASTIALNEGSDLDDVLAGLKDAGADSHSVGTVSKSLVHVSKGIVPKSKTKDAIKTI